jgi:hypothetical protein
LAFVLGPVFFEMDMETTPNRLVPNVRAKELSQAAGRIGRGRHRGGFGDIISTVAGQRQIKIYLKYSF